MSNIPSFNDVCGTVVESLAETIRNREKIIVQLSEEVDRLQETTADAIRKAQMWKNEVEACEGDEKRIYGLLAEVANLQRIVSELTAERDEARRLSLTDSDLAMEDAYLRKEREEKSDSDPATGVQYGDLV